ncbi:PmoA family protein [Actinomadura miaoliensis]|uniref:PmoA family protein n=1 Tax=Actinomadura miaoliensis TaxID=430685 RepID=A0ABP7WQ17_9ACTN
MTAAPVELACAGRTVAEYVTRPDLEATLSPRPYFHPVRTFAGTEVTELMPADHRHHLGVSIAVPDVGGRNFWGGRTFVRDQGPTWLDDHGVQRHLSWTGRAAGAFTETLAWIGADGETALRERRDVRAVAAGDHWALDVAFTLTNVTREPLRIGSPATNGRPGAGYGGFFWRAPGTSTGIRVRTPHAEGERAVHGARTGWLAMTGTAPDGRAWTLAFVPADAATAADPWFVRVGEYPGVGSSLAWERSLDVPPGGRVTRRVVTVVADGHLPAAEIDKLREALCPAP